MISVQASTLVALCPQIELAQRPLSSRGQEMQRSRRVRLAHPVDEGLQRCAAPTG